ncbi:hypothetical protein D6C78_11072, partial [Aureobasidium pullulans]
SPGSVEAAARETPAQVTAASGHGSDDEGRARKRKRIKDVRQSEDVPEDNYRTQLQKLRLETSELKRMWEAQQVEMNEMKQQLKNFKAQQDT